MKTFLGGLLAISLLAGVGSWLWVARLERAWDRDYTLIEDGLYVGGSVAEPPPATWDYPW